MFPPRYINQVEKLKVGCRIVLLQGGYVMYRGKYGAVRLVAAGKTDAYTHPETSAVMPLGWLMKLGNSEEYWLNNV